MQGGTKNDDAVCFAHHRLHKANVILDHVLCTANVSHHEIPMSIEARSDTPRPRAPAEGLMVLCGMLAADVRRQGIILFCLPHRSTRLPKTRVVFKLFVSCWVRREAIASNPDN